MPRRSLSPLLVFSLVAAAILAWALGRWSLEAAYHQPWLSPGLGPLLLLVCAWSWSLVEEPELVDGGARRLGLLLGGAVSLALGQALLYPLVEGKDAVAPLGFAALLAGATLLWPGPWKGPRAVALAAALGLAGVGAATVATRDRTAWDLFAGPAMGQGLLAVFWALFFLAVAALALEAARPRPMPGKEDRLSRSLELGLLGLALLLAAGLRFWKAGLIPQGFWYDEVNLARATQDVVLSQGRVPLYVNEQVENPGVYLWIAAALFKAFGVRLEALRVLSGVFGILAMLPFWALARLWVGRRWALAAVVAFAAMRWMLIPQRIAFMSGFALFWMLSAFWAIWSAQLRGGWKRWLLAGLLLGANMHTYTPARAVPLVALAFLALQALLERRWRRPLRDWGALAAGLLITAGPMLVWIAGHWGEYSFRSSQVSIFTDVKVSGKPLLRELWGTFTKHLLMFNYRGDFNARHNVHFYPHVEFITACVLALALPWTLGRAWWDARGRFLWIWMGTMLAAGIFTMPVEAPQGHRTILAAPALLLAGAWALRELLEPFKASFKGGWPAAAKGLGLALLLGSVFFNAYEVFGIWDGSEATFRSFSPRASAVARRLQGSGPETAVFTSELAKEYQFNGYEWGIFARFALRQQLRSWMPLKAGQVVPAMDLGVPTAKALLIWGESDEGISRAFQAEFPDIAVEKAPQPFPGPGEASYLYLAAEVPWERLPLDPGKEPRPLLYRDAAAR